MTRRRQPGGPSSRDRMRRQGTERSTFSKPIFASLPRSPRYPPQPSKEELRAEAERALREWHRRFDPSGQE